MATRLETVFVEADGLAAWDALVARSAQGTLFHRARWIELIAGAFGRRGRILGVYRNGVLVGGCPIYERRTAGLLISNPPVVAGYAGAALDLPESKRIGKATSEVEQLLEALEAGLRERYQLVRLTQAPGLEDSRPFLWKGWRVTPRYTFRLRPGDPDEILAAFEHNVRKKIRKAEGLGLTVQRISRTAEIISAYEASYGRHGTPPPVPTSLLGGLADRLLDEGFAHGYVTRAPDGTAHAFQIRLADERACYAWVAGSVPEHIADGGFSLMTWKVIGETAASGLDFDFMGANTPTIARFKSAFGGELVPYWETLHATRWAGTLHRLRHARRLGRAGSQG